MLFPGNKMFQFADIFEEGLHRNGIDDPLCLGRIQAGQQFFIRLIGIDQNILDEFQKIDSQSLGVDAGGIHVAQLADDF